MDADKDAIPTSNSTAGAPESTKNKLLETGAGLTQVSFLPPSFSVLSKFLLLAFAERKKNEEYNINTTARVYASQPANSNDNDLDIKLTNTLPRVQNFAPTQRICAHLNAFHAYAHDPKRAPVEANHYCAHVNDEVRQCILYDSAEAGARIIGIEYMITPRLFATLPPSEQRLWHTHTFEVKSGMLTMPRPAHIPASTWSLAEHAEMQQVIHLYGKVYHTWQTDRGDTLPLGEPQLMTSFTAEDQMKGGFEEVVGERDGRLGGDWRERRREREGMEEPVVGRRAGVVCADAVWEEGGRG
ncbi:hypothetical protein J1614_002915, partial [Plenodomus biglobosus]